MLSSALVYLLAESRIKYSTNVLKIRWKGGVGPRKKRLGFCGNLDHVALGLE